MERRTILTLVIAAAVLVVAVGSLLTARLVQKDREHRAAEARRRLAEAHPFGPDGRDIRVAGEKVDRMFKIHMDRLRDVARLCDARDIWGPRRIQVLEENQRAGMEAIRKVQASKYVAAFEPNYPPLPDWLR